MSELDIFVSNVLQYFLFFTTQVTVNFMFTEVEMN